MSTPDEVLAKNRQWSDGINIQQPALLKELSNGQSPEFLWIGCSDSRVPPSIITNSQPGDLFVHRNIANLIIWNDQNLRSVVDYAVSTLKVKHIVICGHYQCGGVKAAESVDIPGPTGEWIQPIRNLQKKHSEFLVQLKDDKAKWDFMCAANVIEQVSNMAGLKEVQHAWQERDDLSIYGWIFEISSGIIDSLISDVSSREKVEQYCSDALTSLQERY